MKLPVTSVTIGGMRITVRIADQEDWGTFHGDAREITISKRAVVEGKFLPTLMHEMLHAALFISGITWAIESNMEEAVVRAIENLYFPAVSRLKKTSGKGK
jgi:hypothetical protein